MHVTSNYYRCRAQRAVLAESLTLHVGSTSSTERIFLSNSKQSTPLRPSRQTLRGFENLFKAQNQNRVA
ncbi:MAG: hypothetical protein VX372_03675 [Verrucomicrobiota bacterium]|nr:hypothetical protein [Verrucomicrobiota bacterium]